MTLTEQNVSATLIRVCLLAGSLQNNLHLAVYLIFSFFSFHVQVKKSVVFIKY